MTTWRVGAGGAMLCDSNGKSLVKLRPGQVVVGDLQVESEAEPARKRVKGYANKMMQADEDKAT